MPAVAQDDRLVEGRDAQAVGAGRFQDPRDGHHPVAVGVGLDDRQDGDPRPGHRAGARARFAASAASVDLDPGGPPERRQPGARPGASSIAVGARRSAGGPARPAAARAEPGRAARSARLVRRRRRRRARLVGPPPAAGAGPEPEPAAGLPPLGDRRPGACGRARSASGRSEARRPGVAEPLADRVAGQAVEVDPEPGGVVRREVLGEERADRPGEDVARPAAREGRVLERRDRHPAVGRGDHGLRALQDDDLAPRRRGVAGGRRPRGVVGGEVAVRRRGRGRCPPGAGRTRPACGRQHARPAVAVPPALDRRERAERLGVEDDRRRAGVVAGREEHPDELGGREARPEPRPDDDRVVLVVEDPGEGRLRVDLLDVVLGQAPSSSPRRPWPRTAAGATPGRRA